MSKTITGINIGSSSLKFVELIHKRGKYRLKNIGVEEFPISESQQGYSNQENFLVETIRKVIRTHKLDPKRIVTGVEGESVVVRMVRVPKMKEKELQEAIKWKAEESIPYPLEDAFLGYHVLKKNLVSPTGPEMSVILAGVKRDTIERYLSVFQQANLCPAVVDVNSLALYNAFRKSKMEAQEGIAIINVGHRVTNLVIATEENPFLVRDIGFGGENITKGLVHALGLTYLQAEQMKKKYSQNGQKLKEELKLNEEEIGEIIRASLEELVKEVVHSFEYFTSNRQGATVQKIIVSGGASLVKNIDKILSLELGIPVERMNPFTNIEYQRGKFQEFPLSKAPLFAVPVGLALREISLI